MLLDLLGMTLLALWSMMVGLALWRSQGGRQTPGLDRLAIALPLGLGALALAVLTLGELGRLNRDGLTTVLALGGAFALVRGGARDLARLTILARRAWLTHRQAGAWRTVDRVLASLVAVGLLATLLGSLAPVTDGDALCYHLQVPKIFLERGAVFFDPDLHETVYPIVTELLYAVALAFRGPEACRLVQWLLGVSFALSVTALARPSLGPRAWWAGGVALLVPAITNGMSAPLNDVALAAFGMAALLAWSRWQDEPTNGSAWRAGLLAGLAVGVKYPALVLVGLLKLAITTRSRRHAALFALALTATGSIWYARAAWATGNPVYPFFRGTFGGAGLEEVLDDIKRPMPVNAWNLVTALGQMTLEPDRFDSFSHQFGPAFLLFLPALLWEKPPRRVWWLVGMGWAFLTLCLTQRQSMRFVLLALGPLSLGVAWLAVRWAERRTIPSSMLLMILLAVMTAQTALAVARVRQGLPVILGLESRQAYLARREPTFVLGHWVDVHLPRDARLIGQDHRGFYLPRPYTMELAHRRRTRLGLARESADSIVSTLRQRGFTHLVLCPPIPTDAVEFDGKLGDLLAPWLQRQAPLFASNLADADGVIRHYSVYDLQATPLVARSQQGDGPW